MAVGPFRRWRGVGTLIPDVEDHTESHEDRVLSFALADLDAPAPREMAAQLASCDGCREYATGLLPRLPELAGGLHPSSVPTAGPMVPEPVGRHWKTWSVACAGATRDRGGGTSGPAASTVPHPPARWRHPAGEPWMWWGALGLVAVIWLVWPETRVLQVQMPGSPPAARAIHRVDATAASGVVVALLDRSRGPAAASPCVTGYAVGLLADLSAGGHAAAGERVRAALERAGRETSCRGRACRVGMVAYRLVRDLRTEDRVRVLRSAYALALLQWATGRAALEDVVGRLRRRAAEGPPGDAEVDAWRELVSRALERGVGHDGE